MIDYFEYINNFKRDDDIPSVKIIDNSSNVIPLVTIGIPTYLRKKTLDDALKSALDQDFDGLYEIIVLDNNPERNDETEIFMNSFRETPFLSYYKNSRNLGLPGNWNRIFTLARSKWVVLLHDDDIIAPSFLNEMIAIAEKYNADIVNSEFYRWDELNSEKPSFCFSQTKYPVVKSTLSSNHLVHFAGMPSGVLYKREVYINEGGVNPDFYPSLDYIFQSLLSYKYNFLIYKKPLTIYRLSINVSSNEKTLKQYIPQDLLFRKYIGTILNYPQFYINLVSKTYSRCRLNALNIDLVELPELNNLKLKRLNKLEFYLFRAYLHLIKKIYTRINRIGVE